MVAAACGVPRPRPAPPAPSPCVPAGRWIDPRTGYAVALPDVVRRGLDADVVLLGEDHDRVAQHRWQLHVAAAIAGATAPVTLGFEMFPRRTQAVLDRWVDGDLDERAFLAETDWAHVWGVDPELYLPIFRFARMHRLRMRALNVDRALVRRVARDGWASVPDDAREGLTTPAAASAAYRARLAGAWRAHRPADAPDDPAALERFVEAQLVWDHAMASAIRSAVADAPGGVVVALVGRGHVEHGDGIPAELTAGNGPRSLVLVPWEPDRPCSELAPDVADLVFGLDAPEPSVDNRR